MKRTLILNLVMMLFLSSCLSANLRFDEELQMFYSEGARKNVDLIEYHNLVVRWLEYTQDNPYRYVDYEICAALKVVGTPAALRLIHDIKKLHKQSGKLL